MLGITLHSCNKDDFSIVSHNSDLSDRDLVINRLSDKFGRENVIPISTYSMFQLKSLTKDISKFYGIPFQEATEGVSTVEQDVRDAIMGAADDKNLFVLTLDDAVKHSKKYREYLEKYPEVHEHIQVLYKQVRSLGRHAGGVLISENLVNKMPLITVKGDLQTPWVEGVNIKHLNEYGFLKFDLLGLETLRIVELCIRNILRKEGNPNPTFLQIRQWFDEKLHPDVLDFNDQEVYRNVYHEGHFCATFQFTGCFDEKTKVLLSDENEQEISKVKVGQLVKSFNEITQEFVDAKVLDVIDSGEKDCIELTLETGETITCTNDHLFLTHNRGWVKAIELCDEDDIVEFSV